MEIREALTSITGEIKKRSTYSIGALNIDHGIDKGIPITIIEFNYNVKAGTIGEIEGEELQKILINNSSRQGIVYVIVKSGGARIDDGIKSLESIAALINKILEKKSKKVIIAIIEGIAAGGSALLTYLSDIRIFIKTKSALFIHGPKILEKISSEKVDPQRLGGSEIHSRYSGIATYIVNDIKDLKTLLEDLHPILLNIIKKNASTTDDTTLAEGYKSIDLSPHTSIEEILETLDAKNTIELFGPLSDKVRVFICRLNAHPVGILWVNNNGTPVRLDVKSLIKIRRFMELMAKLEIPTIYFLNTDGLLDTPKNEQNRLVNEFVETLKTARLNRDRALSIVISYCYGPSYILLSSLNLSTSKIIIWKGGGVGALSPEDAYAISFKLKDLNEDEYVKWFKTRYTNIGVDEYDDKIKIIDPNQTPVEIFNWIRDQQLI